MHQTYYGCLACQCFMSLLPCSALMRQMLGHPAIRSFPTSICKSFWGIALVGVNAENWLVTEIDTLLLLIFP